jgi:hypothetical protein
MYWFIKSSDYYFNGECGVNVRSEFDFTYIKPRKGVYELGYPQELVDVAIKATCPLLLGGL